ncbi:MAG: diaminopimelate decarboxylase [Candidatus Spechtbacterales bacterium]|nr:diaminopimelate decarboxylase [Candidatus Spechtbacterales bacterium]
MTNLRLKQLAKRYGTPLYVYDGATIERQFNVLNNAITYPKKRINFATKANPNIHILKLLRRLGAYVDTSSPGEVWLALEAGYKPKDIVFTGNNLTEEELKFVLKKGIFINADSLSELEKIGKLAPGSKVGVRLNPIYGAGHHSKVITAGENSTFGISIENIGKIKKVAKKYDLKIKGLHQHVGSGILDYRVFLKAADIMLNIVKEFEDVEIIDLGGGFGIPYRPKEKPLDMDKLGEGLTNRFEKLNTELNTELILYLEPGRYLVGESGILLTRATAIQKTPAGEKVVGTNSGMTHLIRPMLYDAYHDIENISNIRDRREKVTVIGNICESTDVFAKDRLIKKVREGDILAIKDTGAYGMSMASRFNGRLLPAEILVGGKKEKVIRKRDKYKDLLPG